MSRAWRGSKGLLAGMFEFPGVVRERGVAGAGTLWDGEAVYPLPPVRHQFTHLHVTYEPVLVLRDGAPDGPDVRWFTPEEIQGLPLPVAQQSIVRYALEALVELDGRRDDASDAHRQHDMDGGGGLPQDG